MKCEPSHRMVWYSTNHENRHFPTMAVPYLRVLRASIDQINVTSATRVAEPVSATVSSVTSTRTVPPRTVMSQ